MEDGVGGRGRQPSYDAIGIGYADRRREDPRIRARILGALGDAARVLDVGSGAGSYEPGDRAVVAVDPSATMIAQRVAGAGPALRARAGALPFGDRSFDAVMAVLTVHHWPDRQAGYSELRRVASRRVVLTYEPAVHNQLWIVAEYVPEIAALDDRRPGFCVDEVAEGIGATEVVTVPVPWDCTDGFIMAYWRQPEAYLDNRMRQATSGFSVISQTAVQRGMRKLRADLASGSWEERHGHLRRLDEFDAGLRLVIGGS
ncbi:MAG: class I SAM-dependent methyltransferase [Acidimicrobiales bacterium]